MILKDIRSERFFKDEEMDLTQILYMKHLKNSEKRKKELNYPLIIFLWYVFIFMLTVVINN